MTDDEPTASESPSASTGDTATDSTADEGPRGRDVEVPLEVYKAVTVFSTLFAVVLVVGGFVLLDEATQRATAAPDEVNVLLAVLGLGAIALGAGTYAFSTRFRAQGMGKSKDEADQPHDNG
jgi:hypothetical protein